jgi:hypothetical protein
MDFLTIFSISFFVVLLFCIAFWILCLIPGIIRIILISLLLAGLVYFLFNPNIILDNKDAEKTEEHFSI